MKGTVQQVMDRATKIMKNDRSTSVALNKEVKQVHDKRIDNLKQDYRINDNVDLAGTAFNP